jgi:hypothetical protein
MHIIVIEALINPSSQRIISGGKIVWHLRANIKKLHLWNSKWKITHPMEG